MNPVFSFLRETAGRFIVPRLEAKLRRFEGQLKEPRTLQRELLFAKLRRAAGSAFGRDHGFASIRTVEDFRKQVPVANYDYYWPYIERVVNGDVEAMFPAGEKLLMFTLSSGTTATPKLIPITRTWMDEYRRGWQVWGVKAFLDHPKLFYAKLAGIAGHWDMRRTPTNIACGMASGLSARMQGFFTRMVYCIPSVVFEIEDSNAKYYTALRLALCERAGLFVTATPATVVNFARLGDHFKERLIRDVADGSLSEDFAVPQAIRRRLARRIGKADRTRALELERIVAETGRLLPKDYWQLSLVACWLGGTVGGYARHIAEYYGPAPRRDIGLLCSEGRFTVPMEDETPAGALEVASHYYEFIPEEEIDSPNPNVLECDELEEGRQYYILLTTSSGLYRYHISDVMRCVGFRGRTPLLEFLNKGQRFSDMEGEKLSEHQLVEAVAHAAGAAGMKITGFTAVPIRPSEPAGIPYYALMVEEQEADDPARVARFLSSVDAWLARNNVMYEGKRSDAYLDAPRLLKVPAGSWTRFDQEEIKRRGVGEDHYKHPSLVLDPAFTARFRIVGEIALERPS